MDTYWDAFIKKYNDRLVDIPPEIEKEREASMKL